MYLIDTNVISAMSPVTAVQNREIIDWMNSTKAPLYLSVVTASEVQAGISRARRIGATAKALKLETWWGNVQAVYDGRILPLDLEIATEVGRMADEMRAFDPTYEDAAIAATAKLHGLTVLTRNERHFTPLGVKVRNPFKSLPDD